MSAFDQSGHWLPLRPPLEFASLSYYDVFVSGGAAT
jgi:hypothetical protein